MNIAHNITAMNTYNKMNIATNYSNKSMEKLSSGYAINRASDDAAGLSISEKMRSQIRGLNQASENAEQGISMIQTAEGALNEDHAILQRIRELAVQAANGTNSSEDKEAIQSEINELTSEINRIANTTEFNGMKVLNGDFSEEANTTVAAKGGDLDFYISKGISNDTDLEFVGNVTISDSDVINFGSLDTSKENFIKVFCKDGTLNVSYTLQDTSGNQQKVVCKKLLNDSDGNYIYNSNGINFTISKESAKDYIESQPSEDKCFELDFQVACDGQNVFNAKKTYSTLNDYEDDSSIYGSITDFHLDDYSIDRLNYDTVEIIYDNNDYHYSDCLEVKFYKDGNLVIDDVINGEGNGPGEFLRQYNANGIKFNLEGTSDFSDTGRIHATIDLKDKLGVEEVGNRKKVINSSSTNTVNNYIDKNFYESTIKMYNKGTGTSIGDTEKLIFPKTNITFEANEDGFKAKFTGYNGVTYTSDLFEWPDDIHGDYNYDITINDFSTAVLTADEKTAMSKLNIPLKFTVTDFATKEQVINLVNDSSKFYVSTSYSNDFTISLYNSSGIYKSSNVSTNYNAIIASGKDFDNSDTEFIEGNGKTGSTYNNISFDPIANPDSTFSFALTMKDAAGNTIPLTMKLTSVNGNGTSLDPIYLNRYWHYGTKYDYELETYVTDTRYSYYNSFSSNLSYNGIKYLAFDNDSNPLNEPGGSITLGFNITNDIAYQMPDGSTVAANTNIASPSYSISISKNMTETELENIISSITGADVYDNGPKSTYNFNCYNSNIGSTTINKKYNKVTYTEDVTYEDVELDNEKDNGLHFHVGANKDQTIKSYFGNMTASKLGLTGYGDGYTKYNGVTNGETSVLAQKGLSVLSRKDANNAIKKIDEAINKVSQERSKFGSIQNRLEYTINNLDTTSENMTNAESTIRDVDMANEMMELTKNQILQQASQAILSQAMQTPQQVLQLLQ